MGPSHLYLSIYSHLCIYVSWNCRKFSPGWTNHISQVFKSSYAEEFMCVRSRNSKWWYVRNLEQFWRSFDDRMQIIAKATLVVYAEAALYFYHYMLLFLIKICWRHVCNLLPIYPLFLNKFIFVALFALSLHHYKEPVGFHVLFLPLVFSLCWWNSVKNRSPMISIWSQQGLQKFVYLIAFLLNSALPPLIPYRWIHLL